MVDALNNGNKWGAGAKPLLKKIPRPTAGGPKQAAKLRVSGEYKQHESWYKWDIKESLPARFSGP